MLPLQQNMFSNVPLTNIPKEKRRRRNLDKTHPKEKSSPVRQRERQGDYGRHPLQVGRIRQFLQERKQDSLLVICDQNAHPQIGQWIEQIGVNDNQADDRGE
jgi:hypothetical protein